MKQKAFTLIELLVVVIILSILASLGVVKHYDQKRRTEFLSALSQVRSLAAVAKNYFLTTGSYATTANTANTNAVYGVNIMDANYYNFCVIDSGVSPPSFSMTFDYHGGGTGASTAIYTFDKDGYRTSCGGTECVPDW